MGATPYTWHATFNLRKRKPRPGENPDVPVYQQQFERFGLNAWKEWVDFEFEWRDIEWAKDG